MIFRSDRKKTIEFCQAQPITLMSRPDVPDTQCVTCFLFILGYFLPFYPPNNPKNQNFKKLKKKKTPGDIIILYMCTKNNDHMMYGSWDMVRNRHKQMDWQKKWHIEVGAPPTKKDRYKIMQTYKGLYWTKQWPHTNNT